MEPTVTEGDIQEGSAHIPMYNPHILPLHTLFQIKDVTAMLTGWFM